MKPQNQLVSLVKSELERRTSGSSSALVVRSPGRLNVIGEHTDYNDGFVMPSAIDRAIYIGLSPRLDSEGNLHSIDFQESHSFDVTHPVKSPKAWANYLVGVVDELKRGGYSIGGFDCVFAGDIPIGAGLSSSAAVEAGLAFALNTAFELQIGRTELAAIAQRAENNFVGVKCGIMDQFASLLSEGSSVLNLDCRSLEYDLIPFKAPDIRFVLCDTGVKHSLASSEYNLRRQECERAVNVLRQSSSHIESLRDATLEMLEAHRMELDGTAYKRALYVLEENARVESAASALRSDDFKALGELLFMSHAGLRDKFEVSCDELNTLVDAASEIEAVVGARMMGGGFGGCTLNLVHEDGLSEFNERIMLAYDKIGTTPRIYECRLMPGTEILNNQSLRELD